MMGKRVITHVHENEISPKILDTFLFWIVRSFSSEKIVVSRFLEENPKLGSEPITLIPNVVNPKISEQSSPVSWSSDDFTVLMLASLRPYKGIQEFVKLAGQLPGLRFILVLSDPAEEVKKWTNALEISSNLEVFPVQQDVIRFYHRSHLLLNLTHPDKCLETFGMTALEGFCFGMPAIVPTGGGVAELVEDDVNGYRIDYTNLELLSNKILELKQNPVLWEQLSSGAVDKSFEYSIGVFEQKVLKLLKG